MVALLDKDQNSFRCVHDMTSDSADASGTILINLNDLHKTREDKSVLCYKRKSSQRLSSKKTTKNEHVQSFHAFRKRFRCGICKNCKAENCGECRFCLDMRMFGGRGLLRKPCVFRVCFNKKRYKKLNDMRSAAEKGVMTRVEENLLIKEAKEKKCTVKLRDILAPSFLSKAQVKLESDDTTEKHPESNPNDSPVWRSNRKRTSSTITGQTSDFVSGQISKRMKKSIKSNLDDLNLNSLIQEIEITNKKDKEVFESEKQERCLSQKRLLRYTLYRKSLNITNTLLKEQTAKTKKKRLKPYEYLKYASEDFCDLSPPMLEPQDKDCENSGDEDSCPPVLQTYHEKMDKVKLSFSGRFCKPNLAYSKEEFVTNLKDLNALKRQMCKKANPKRKPVKVSDTPVEIERVDDSNTIIKQEPGEFNLNLTGQETVSTEDKKQHDSPVIRSILKSKVMQRKNPEKRKREKPTTERIVDSVYENLSQKSSLQNVPRIPVQQNVIKQTVNQLAKEKKFVKFFQLDVGEKIIFIPTDGAAVIPKAYVMDKAIGKPEGEIDYTSSFIKSMSNTACTSSIKQESIDDTQEESLPKITSVFSLSSDCDTSSTDIDETQSGVKVEPETLTSANCSNHENSSFQSAKSTSLLGETDALDTDKRFSFRNVNSDLERERSIQNLVRETMTKLVQQGTVIKPKIEENHYLQIKMEDVDQKKTQQSLITTDVRQQEEHYQNTSNDVKQNINTTTFDKNFLDENKTDLQNANLTTKTLCIPKVSFQPTDVTIKNVEATPVSVYSCGGKPLPPSSDIMKLGNLEPLEKMKSKVFTAPAQSTVSSADSELKHDTRPSVIKTEAETKRQPVIAPKTVRIIKPQVGSDPQHLFFIPISTASSETKPMYSLLMNKGVQKPVSTGAAPLYSLVIRNPTTQSTTTTPTVLAQSYQKISPTTPTVLAQSYQKIATYTGQPKILIAKGQPPTSILQTQLPTILTKASTIKSQTSSENIPSSEPTAVLNKLIEAKNKCVDMHKVNEQTRSNEMAAERTSPEIKTNAHAIKPSFQSYVATDQNLIAEGEKESKLRSILTDDEIPQQTTVIKSEFNITPDRKEKTKHSEDPFHSSIVKSEPDETGEYEILTFPNIKKERVDSETESESETVSSKKSFKSKTRRRKQLLEENFTHVHAEETDTEERIRRLREKLREQELKCAKLKSSLLSSDEID